MTEYDYSPEAYERFMKNQTRVSNWVSDQASHSSYYSNPFIPRATTTPPEANYHHSSHHHEHPSRRSSSRPPSNSGRPERHRSYTTPTPRAIGTAPIYKPPISHSSTRVPLVVHQPQPQRAYHPQGYYQTSPVADNISPTKSHGSTIYKTYTYDPYTNREIVLPPPRRGETYVIVPPKGRRVEVVHESSSRSSSRSSYTQTPTKKPTQPLLKRLLTTLGPASSGDSARTRGSARHARRESH